MQRNILLLLLLSITSLRLAADTTDDKTAWVSQLEQTDIIDSVVYVPQTGIYSNMLVYHIYFHQPLSHDGLSNELFQMRCAMVMPSDADPATCANQMYIQGYDINTMWKYTSMCYGISLSEIASRYRGALFMPEHRYFSASSPDECWTRLDYCNSYEAACDFHNLLQALKTVFKGKWAISGVSKGGIETAAQHAYFPDDADIFVPYSGPLCQGIADKRLHKYITDNGWTEQLRERMKKLMRGMIEDTGAAEVFAMLTRQTDPDASDYFCRKSYYENLLEILVDAHAYTARNNINKVLDNNDTLRASIKRTYDFSPYDADSYLNALYAQNQSLNATSAWKPFIPKKTNAPKQSPEVSFSIKKEEWDKNDLMAFFYQSGHEMGTYTFDFHNLYDKPEEQAIADSLQAFFDQDGGDIYFMYFPFFRDVAYDDALKTLIEQKTKDAGKPVIYLYGEDDCWTGCAIDDEFINGDTSRKFVLSAQRHSLAIGSGTDEERAEIWPLIDAVMNSSTGIRSVEAKCATRDTDACYNLMGQRVSPDTRGIIICGGKKFRRIK